MHCNYEQEGLIRLLSRHAVASQPVEHAIVDSFGVVTPVECVPHIAQLAGTVMASPPHPDDGIRGSSIEYIPLIESIDAAPGPAPRRS